MEGFQLLFTPVGAHSRSKIMWDVWICRKWDLPTGYIKVQMVLTRFGINPAYPIWANPVFQEETTPDGSKVGYYLSHWLYW